MLGFLLSLLVVPCYAQTATPSATTVPTAVPTTAQTFIFKDVPGSARRGEQFSLNLELSGASANAAYHFKVYGGPSGDNYAIKDLGTDWENGFNGEWAKMPTSTTDSTGHVLITMNLMAYSDKPSGTYQLYGKIQELSISTAAVNIAINDPIPTNTPTNTPVPTTTATITPTPKPTVYMSPTPTDIPATKLTPIIEPTSSFTDSTPTPTPIPSIVTLTNSDISVSKPENKNASLTNFLPIIFIGLGAVLLAVPFIIPKFKKNVPKI